MPRIGLLGIMQALYDDMLPGHRRAPGGVRRASSAPRSTASPTSSVAPPVKDREDTERAMREFEAPTSTACSS